MTETIEVKGKEYEAEIKEIGRNSWIGSASGHGIYVHSVTGSSKKALLSNLAIAISQEIMKQDGTLGNQKQD